MDEKRREAWRQYALAADRVGVSVVAEHADAMLAAEEQRFGALGSAPPTTAPTQKGWVSATELLMLNDRILEREATLRAKGHNQAADAVMGIFELVLALVTYTEERDKGDCDG